MRRILVVGPLLCSCLLFAQAGYALIFDESELIYEETYVGETSSPLSPEVDTTSIGGLIILDFGTTSLTGDALHITTPGLLDVGFASSPTPTASTIGPASVGVRGRFAGATFGGSGEAWADVVLTSGEDFVARLYLFSSGVALLAIGSLADTDGTTVVELPTLNTEAILAGSSFCIDLFVDVSSSTAFASIEIPGLPTVSAIYTLPAGPFVPDFTLVTQRAGFDGVVAPPLSFELDLTGLELYADADLCVTGDLIAHWPFSGDADDAGPCMLHGISIGPTLTSDPLGIGSSAYSFGGGLDEINLGNSPPLRPSLPFTLSMFVRNRCPVGVECALFMNDRVAGMYSGFRMAVSFSSEGRWYVRLGDGGSPSPNSRRDAIAAVPLTTNVWHHVAAVVRSETDVDLYLNGTPVAVGYEGNGGPLHYLGGEAGIGVGADSGDSFQGDIDEVFLFDRALSPSEIMALPEPAFTSGFGFAVGMLIALRLRRAGSSQPSTHRIIFGRDDRK